MEKHHHTRLFVAASALLTLGFFSLVLGSAPGYAAPTTRYVSASGDCGGSTPCYATIQSAVDTSASGDSIKVAAGVYTSTGFQVVYIDKALSITGGYTTTNWTDSLSTTNATVIDAEYVSRRRGMYIDGSGVADTITLSGLTIQRGNAGSQTGGGLYVHGGSVVLRDSQVFTNTSADGGGIFINTGQMVIDSDLFRSNTATGGGAVFLNQGVASIASSTFVNNRGAWDSSGGGAIHLEGGSISLVNSTLLSNDGHLGGGVAQFGGVLTVTSSLIQNNSSYYGGGLYLRGGIAAIRASEILTNTGSFYGGGIYSESAFSGLGSSEISGNRIAGNYAHETGGGISSFGDIVRDNTIASNSALYGGGVYMRLIASAQVNRIEGNTIINNIARDGGGVLVCTDYGWEMPYTATLEANRIISNTASSAGGGIEIAGPIVTSTNDIVARNSSLYEGIYVSAGHFNLRHSTIVSNGKYALDRVGGVVTITNSIIVSHTLGALYGPSVSADHNLFFGNGATCGGGAVCSNSIAGDPKFTNPATDDYHIQSDSPVINAGINTGVTKDMDDQLRPYLGYDLGSDEYWPPGATIGTLVSSVSPSVVGQTVSFTARLVAGSGMPSGAITFKDGSTTICPNVPMVGGKAVCTVSFPSVGTRAITAAYSGDSTFNPSTITLNGGHTVNKASTATVLTAHSPHPSKVAEAVTVGYSVVVNAPGSGTPSGNVTVSDGADSCTATVAAGNCVLTLSTVGTRTLTAAYAGDSNLNGSSSIGVLHTVTRPEFRLHLPLVTR